MNHNKSKFNFKSGKDAKDMVLRKLAYNFFKNGEITLPIERSKKILPVIESLVYRAAKTDQASKNVLLRFFGNFDFIKELQALAAVKTKSFPMGGVVKIRKDMPRMSDGSYMSQVVWSQKK